eukprot:g1893.t1
MQSFFISLLAASATVAASKPVQVELWYESFCEGCQHLITESLIPISKLPGMTSAVNFSVIPSGNAHMTPLGSITCQHGEFECTGNAYENCVMNELNYEWSKYSPFILCMEKEGDDMLKHVDECCAEVNVDATKMKECAGIPGVPGSEGKKLLEAAYRATGNHTYVPWFRINGEHVPTAEESKAAMLKEICGAIEGPKPDACRSIDEGPKRSYNGEAACSYPSQKTCDADKACAWCESAAVPSSCHTMKDAKSLPSSVFKCDI